jgi:hypothetical protein
LAARKYEVRDPDLARKILARNPSPTLVDEEKLGTSEETCRVCEAFNTRVGCLEPGAATSSSRNDTRT